MRHLDEGTIHTWLDGALSSEEAARVEAHVADCTACAEAVAEARGLIAASSRILTALDNVPNVRGARSAKGAEGARPFLVTWLVRERIAAVVALVIAGGALAVAVSREGREASRVQIASAPVAPVAAVELAAADSPAPPPAASAPQKDDQTRRRIGRGAQPSPVRARDFAVAETAARADSVPIPQELRVAEEVTTRAVAAPPVRTDDTARSMVVAQAEREEVRQRSAEGKSSLGEKVVGALPRRQAADAAANFAEPRPAAPGYSGGVSAAAVAGDRRLVHDERMIEAGREVRRRIYTVDGILVTLDERLPSPADELSQARVEPNAAAAAPAAPRDSAKESTNTIRWTDARGAELTLTGPASVARLERIRKLLGF